MVLLGSLHYKDLLLDLKNLIVAIFHKMNMDMNPVPSVVIDQQPQNSEVQVEVEVEGHEVIGLPMPIADNNTDFWLSHSSLFGLHIPPEFICGVLCRDDNFTIPIQDISIRYDGTDWFWRSLVGYQERIVIENQRLNQEIMTFYMDPKQSLIDIFLQDRPESYGWIRTDPNNGISLEDGAESGFVENQPVLVIKKMEVEQAGMKICLSSTNQEVGVAQVTHTIKRCGRGMWCYFKPKIWTEIQFLISPQLDETRSP